MRFQRKSRMRSYQFLSGNQGFLRQTIWNKSLKKRRIPGLRRKLTPHSEVTLEKVYLECTHFRLLDTLLGFLGLQNVIPFRSYTGNDTA